MLKVFQDHTGIPQFSIGSQKQLAGRAFSVANLSTFQNVGARPHIDVGELAGGHCVQANQTVEDIGTRLASRSDSM